MPATPNRYEQVLIDAAREREHRRENDFAVIRRLQRVVAMRESAARFDSSLPVEPK